MTLTNNLIKLQLLALMAMALVFTACGDDEDEEDKVAPDSYSAFDGVSYAEATTRLDKVAELTTELKKGNNGEVSDEQTMLSIFNDDIASATNTSVVETYRGYLTTHASISGDNNVAENGTPGILTKNDGSGSYLVDGNGKEYVQLVEKGLFGSCFLHQIVQLIGTGDNVDAAKWDLAFGYLGVPTDFPANTDGLFGVGKYCNSRDGLLGTNNDLIKPFIDGRFNLNEGEDVATQAQSAISAVELVLAATGIHYINSTLGALDDQAVISHAMSEAEGFIKGVKFNPNHRISDADYDQVISLLGDNYFEVSTADLTQARDILSTAYGIDPSVASQL